MCDRFARKFDVQTSYNICCERQISSGYLSHDSVFDRRTPHPWGEGEEVVIVCSVNVLSLGIVSILLISMGFTLIPEKKRFPVQERQICY